MAMLGSLQGPMQGLPSAFWRRSWRDQCRKLPRWLFVASVSWALGCAALPEPAKLPDVEQASPLPRRTTPIASYTLEAHLDAETHVVKGSGTIRFTNPSPKSTKELYFHLYLNAFESDKTLFRRGRASRSGNRKGRPGWTKVHSLKCAALGSGDLWDQAAEYSPDDKDDRTDIRVALPRALQGGETVELEIEFTSQLPQVVERTGFDGKFHLVAQWFPKLAKREKDGTWAHFPFHPHGEFYANFGDYDVTLDVPKDYIVASTGALKRVSTSDTRSRYRAKAASVHDFAWTAWPFFEVEERDIEGTHVRLLHPPHTPFVTATTWDTLERGLPSLGAAYGPYPFADLTVVQPPFFGSRAGGMEYPQFITTGGSEIYNLLGLRLGAIVTIHELGHQWFQGLVATHEMEYPFLDEGLTSFAEARFLEERYGAGSAFDNPLLRVSRRAANRYRALLRRYKSPIASSAPEFKSFGAIGGLVYAKTALALDTFGEVYSFDKLHDALRHYATKHRFDHPTPTDFFAALEARIGPEARKQAELIFLKQGRVDYQITKLTTTPKNAGWETVLEWKKTGSLEFPTSITVGFQDGTERQTAIDGKSGKLVLTHSGPALFAHLDAERRILLDENLENNRRYVSNQRVEQTQLFHSGSALVSWALATFTL